MKSIALIPVYNEEKTIRDVVKESGKYVNEVLIVYDKSTDRTWEKIRGFSPVIKLTERRGKGFALRRGFAYALQKKFDVIVTLDSDGEKDPKDIPHLIDFLGKNKADIVTGYRDRHRSRIRFFLNRFSNWWIKLATGYALNDVLSGFSVLTCDTLRRLDLKSNRFEIETEILLEARKNNLRVLEYPIRIKTISKSKLNLKNKIQINNFYDMWLIKNYRHLGLNFFQKMFLIFFSYLGLSMGKIITGFENEHLA